MKKNSINFTQLNHKEIYDVCNILQFNSIDSLKKVYNSFLIKSLSENYTIQDKIVFEAVKKLLKL